MKTLKESIMDNEEEAEHKLNTAECFNKLYKLIEPYRSKTAPFNKGNNFARNVDIKDSDKADMLNVFISLGLVPDSIRDSVELGIYNLYYEHNSIGVDSAISVYTERVKIARRDWYLSYEVNNQYIYFNYDPTLMRKLFTARQIQEIEDKLKSIGFECVVETDRYAQVRTFSKKI